MPDLSSADYAILILLKTEGRQVSNTELNRQYGITLIGPACMRLNGTGYVDSDTTRRPYRHQLTEDGRKLLAEPLSIDSDVVEPKAKRSPGEKALWAAVVSLFNLQPAPTAAVFRSTEDRIRSAYAELGAQPGQWIDLARLRQLLTDVSRAEQDRAFVRLLESDDVRLEPEPHRHRLGAEDRAAAVRIGGEDRHKLAIGVR